MGIFSTKSNTEKFLDFAKSTKGIFTGIGLGALGTTMCFPKGRKFLSDLLECMAEVENEKKAEALEELNDYSSYELRQMKEAYNEHRWDD